MLVSGRVRPGKLPARPSKIIVGRQAIHFGYQVLEQFRGVQALIPKREFFPVAVGLRIECDAWCFLEGLSFLMVDYYAQSIFSGKKKAQIVMMLFLFFSFCPNRISCFLYGSLCVKTTLAFFGCPHIELG